MLRAFTPTKGTRDARIDFLRGLAMVCVIVDHSQRSSVLSWFSYQRFWTVTAAEVFVVLSGVALGMAYGPRLARDGWRSVVGKLCRRALTLYFAFIAVSVSLLLISLAGIDVSTVASWDPAAVSWFIDPRTMNAADWRDLFTLRYGSWTFEIVGLYVWLVLLAGPCLILMRRFGWRPLLIGSWIAYLSYRIAPHQLTMQEFEVVFPILAWQLLFIHGIVIGYYREPIGAWMKRCPKIVPIAVGGMSVVFAMFALSNPTVDGPEWLRWALVSPERFVSMYERYFALSDLGIGRLLNLAVALPFGYALLAWGWAFAGRLQGLFVTIGQQSLAAFVLHVYGILVLAHLTTDELQANTLMQVVLILAIAGLLHGLRRWRALTVSVPVQRLDARRA